MDIANSAFGAVSVNRWIVFNWNALREKEGVKAAFVSVNRWIVFNWNYEIFGIHKCVRMFQLIVG